MDSFVDFLGQAARVKPSSRQLNWFDTEFYGFLHFSPNTYTNLEWGNGTENPSIFDPQKLDCDQWVEALKSAGMKGAVITAKHHDGFCLWPSKFTEHSVKNSPCKRDIVGELAKACERGGIKFGFYLSPWDRNSKYYGTDEYNDYFCNQLTELLTGYGEVFHVWFDNACGEGANGKRQQYRFDRFIELIRKYQPNATVFNDYGPDVRWCGNESGSARAAEWAVVPSELCSRAEVQTGSGPFCGDLSSMYNWDDDIGFMSNIIYSKGLAFCGSEIDMSIRPGWFWHEKEEPHSLERLFKTYLDSVGNNACLNLNVPPNRDGLLDSRDVARLAELGKKIKDEFANNLAADATVVRTDIGAGNQCAYDLTLPCEREIKYLVLAEDISQGQRVESFRIECREDDGYFAPGQSRAGTSIGHKKIITMNRKVRTLRLIITGARGEVVLKPIEIY